jgi:serine/threonine-protein kinase
MENLQLKRYTIREKIGEGGMADVYLAYDNVLKRDCAIKIMKSELSSDPVARIRFRREADAAANLQHPNIVSIYDVGESNNRPFIVMEYVKGQTLKELILQRGAIEKREAVFIATQIAEGLKAAHEGGVVHRDVKPHNVLIKSDGTAKITDFGIASVQGAIQLTQHDSVMGSVHYLAPECSRGEAASFQSDIYSLGIVLYEMLTGDLPYKGEAAVQVAMKHMQEEIPSVRSVNNSIEQSIENIIIKATSKSKVTRYQNAQEILEDLRNALTPEHAFDKKIELVAAAPANGEETRVIQDLDTLKPAKKKLSTRDKVLISVIAAAILGLLILLVSSLLGNSNSEGEYFELPDVTNMSIEEATDELERLDLVVASAHEYELHDTIEKDLVIESDPVPNTLVKEGDEIKFLVSLGVAFEVEDYSGLTLTEARNKLLNVDFVNLSIETEESTEHEENIVIRQEGLAPGDKLDPSKEYNLILIISKPSVFQLPNLVGENYLDAKSDLEALGATVEFNPQDSSTLSDEEWEETEFEVVTRMSPLAGSSYSTASKLPVVLTYWEKSDREIVKADKTALTALIDNATSLDVSNKTEDSVRSLNIAIENARNVINNDDATQQQVDSALSNLQQSIDFLRDVTLPPQNPTVNPMVETDTIVSGQSQAGLTVRVTNEHNIELGIGPTNNDGSFAVSIPQQAAGTVIYVTASDMEGLTSSKIPVLVGSSQQEPPAEGGN